MNWQEFLWGDANVTFLAQIMIRTVVMYLILLFALAILGKRGV